MLVNNNVEPVKKQKSREYPAISLKKAIEFARRIYEKDRWLEAPMLTAVRHMGYAGLNGGSRPAISALRKYGLIEYMGSGDNMMVKLTDIAKRIFVPLNEQERASAVWEAMNSPQVHLELLSAFPNWDLPSDENLAARLEREFRFQHGAVKPFIADLRESLEYARQFGQSQTDTSHRDVELDESEISSGAGNGDGTGFGGGAGSGAGFGDGTGTGAAGSGQRSNELMKLPMAGSSVYIVLPQVLESGEAKRILSWLKRVVTPAVEFASDQGDVDEAE